MSEAWNDFWAADRHGGGCLAASAEWHAIEAAQRRIWKEFVKPIPRGGRVLDLATGNGVVMGWLLAERRDLRPVGVDLASHLPRPPKGARSRGGVAMEALPFPDDSQDAVVSQFGVEYGDLTRVAREIGRVLKKGGRLGLITHRLDGPILAHNRPRRDGLRWALEELELISKARAGLALRHLGILVPPALAAAPQEAASRYGAGSAAWEFAEAIVQTLNLGRHDSARNVLDTLDTLETKARNEIGRIDSLETACQATADLGRLEQLFVTNGLHLETREAVHEPYATRPFADAWFLRYR